MVWMTMAMIRMKRVYKAQLNDPDDGSLHEMLDNPDDESLQDKNG
jgi:hypothetical protein